MGTGQGQLDELVNQVTELTRLALDVVEEPVAGVRGKLGDAAQHGGVGTQAGQRGPQLVGGVVHQPFLGLAGGDNTGEHPAERRGEPSDLVASAHQAPAPSESTRPSALTSSATPASRTRRRVMRPASSRPAPAATSMTTKLAPSISLAMPPST